jgi:hypothetical protein
MTEDEAKTKWCPFVRHSDDSGGSFNRGMFPGDATNKGRTNDCWQCNCIASQCMAWRWDQTRWMLEHDDRGMLMRPPKDGVPRGYCGLAGKS